MKKYLFMAVAGMLALSSCSNDSDELIITEAPHEMTFTAGYADGDATRAAIHADKSVTWVSGDRITIFSTNNSSGAVFETSNTGATATFTGTANDDSKFYAVYPNTGTSLEGTTIKGLQIFNDQYPDFITDNDQKWGWDKWSAIAVAEADPGEALKFKNICAVLKVKLNKNSGDPVSVNVKADENMCGKFNYNTATNTISNITLGVNYVYCDVHEDGVFNIYLLIIPGTYTNFNLLVKDRDTTKASNTKTDTVTFAAGKVYDLGSYNV